MNKKKLLALLMALVMTLTLVPVTAFAEGNEAKIGNTEYATLAEAVTAASAGATVEITVAGTYTLPNLSENITIEGTVSGVVFNCVGNYGESIASVPNGATFRNVTFNMGQAIYHGFQHAGTITMDHCRINGLFFSYGNMLFTDCTFVQTATDGDRNIMWVYGPGTVSYTNCSFTSPAGKFLHLYNEGNGNTGDHIVNVTGCNFVNTKASEGKAAVNVKEKCNENGNILQYDVTITNCTVSGPFPSSTSVDDTATFFDGGLYMLDNRLDDSAQTKIKVTVDNKQVYPAVAEPIYVAQIGEDATKQFTTLQAAINAAQNGDTVKLLADDGVWEQIVIASGKDIILDLNDRTVSYNAAPVIVQGKLTVMDSDIDKVKGSLIRSYGDCGIKVQSGGELVFNSGNVYAQEMAVLFYGPNAKGTINGGEFVASDNAVLGTNGSKDLGGSEITINGGVFSGAIETSGYVACGIYAANDDTWNVNDGQFYITGGAGIVARAGVVNVSGDVSIETSGNVTGRVGDSRVVVPCAAIVFDAEANYPGLNGDSKINITGGYFNSYKFSGTNPEAAETIVSVRPNDATSRISISGGEFNIEPAAGFVADDYAAMKVIETDDYFCWVVDHKINEDAAVTMKQTSTVDDAALESLGITDAATVTGITEKTEVFGVKLSTSATVPSTESSEKKSGLQAVVDKAKEVNGEAIDQATSIDVDVKVTVTPTAYTNNNTAQTATFKLEPKATVTATKTFEDADPVVTTIENVEVTNDMIDQLQDITVYIYTGFEPKQIIHREDNNGSIIEVFNEGDFDYYDEGALTGVVSLVVHHFSDLEFSADPGVAEINGTKYATLAKAFEEATDGQTITLLQDVTLNDRLFVNAGETPSFDSNGRYATSSVNKSITLDLNGKDITTSSNIALAGGSLNITGSGTIKSTAPGLAPVEIRGTGDLASKRTLTIGENVTLDGSTTGYGLNVFGSNEGNTANNIEVNVNGTVKGTLFVLGNLTNANNDINIVVNGTVDAPNAAGDDINVGIALNGNGHVTVNEGATVTGDTGIEVRAGELTVNGGTITGTAATYSATPNGSGSSTKGAGIAIVQHTTKLPIVATINDGDISSLAEGKAITVSAVEQGTNMAIVEVNSAVQPYSVAPDGYVWKQGANNMYTLAEAVAQIGETKYATLADAFAAVSNGQSVTINLLQDASGAGIFVAADGQKYITLELNGHTYTCIGPAVGSTGTENQAFHLEKGNTIIIKDGTITSDSNDVKMLVQNYSNLTLNNATLDGTHINGKFTLSTNNGTTRIENSTINAKAGGVAFDVCSFGSYTGNTVFVTDNSVINGKVEVSVEGSQNVSTSVTLNVDVATTINGNIIISNSSTDQTVTEKVALNSGTLNGNIVMGTKADEATVTKSSDFDSTKAPDGYMWVNNTQTGISTLTEKPIKALGGSLRKRAHGGDKNYLVYDETDLRIGFEVTDSKNFSTERSVFTYSVVGTNISGEVTAEKFDSNTGTTNLVLTAIPAEYYNYSINVTLYMRDNSGKLIDTASSATSVAAVASGLNSEEYPAWQSYANQICELAQQQPQPQQP